MTVIFWIITITISIMLIIVGASGIKNTLVKRDYLMSPTKTDLIINTAGSVIIFLVGAMYLILSISEKLFY